MSIQSFLHGPGTLTLDGTSDITLSEQMTSVDITPTENVTAGEVVDVLSGGQLTTEDDVNTTWTLGGTCLQALEDAGIVAYSWDQDGVEVTFKWVPNTVADKAVTGTVRVAAIKLGGPVKKRNQSDFTWKIIGTPVLGDATP